MIDRAVVKAELGRALQGLGEIQRRADAGGIALTPEEREAIDRAGITVAVLHYHVRVELEALAIAARTRDVDPFGEVSGAEVRG